MKRKILALGVSGFLMASSVAQALTSLMPVTPKNSKEARFTVTSKAGRSDTVEFVIRRDIQGISLPGRAAYLEDARTDEKSLGTRLKLEEEKDKTLIFRFSVPEKRIADTTFRLWGNGTAGEGVTFELKLSDFWKK